MFIGILSQFISKKVVKEMRKFQKWKAKQMSAYITFSIVKKPKK